MAAALKMAKTPPEKIDYINAHGTSTQANDSGPNPVAAKMARKRVKNTEIFFTLATCSSQSHDFGT